MTLIRSWRFITIMLASFSLSLSMTHLLELPQSAREYTHAVNALIKIIGLSLLAISVLVETPRKRVTHSD